MNASEPTTRTFVEIVGKTKSGKPSRKTHRLHWVICDECGEGIWTSRLAKSKGDPIPGMTCRMTPRCRGKHRKGDDGASIEGEG